jgi:uncharacterized protein YbjT (DUF2867 family)
VATSIVMMGATGAVGGIAARTLASMATVDRLTLLGRRRAEGLSDASVAQHVVDVMEPSSYAALLPGHDGAVCTLGVGQPSKVSREELVRIDKTAVLAFADACKAAGVRRFSLLSSVGASATSPNFYLRTKGELEDGLRRLGFERLSLFEPSVIITPQNRYGWSQALVLAAMPVINPLLAGALRKFRGIEIGTLGRAIAHDALDDAPGENVIRFDRIRAIADRSV